MAVQRRAVRPSEPGFEFKRQTVSAVNLDKPAFSGVECEHGNDVAACVAWPQSHKVGLIFRETRVLELYRFSLAVRSTLAALEQSARCCGIFADWVRYRVEIIVLQDLLVFWAPQELGHRILVC